MIMRGGGEWGKGSFDPWSSFSWASVVEGCDEVQMASAAFGVQLCPDAGRHFCRTACAHAAISWPSSRWGYGPQGLREGTLTKETL